MSNEAPLLRSTPALQGGKLRPTCLSFPETLSQSVAAISPTCTAAINATVVFSLAGNGTWITYLLAAVGLCVVNGHIGYFSRRTATPGSLYAYVAQTLGPDLGFVAGWCSVIAYLFTAMSVFGLAAHYLLLFVPHLPYEVPHVALLGLCSFLVWYVAYRDIRFSARLMLGSEAFSVCLILLIGFLVCVHYRTFLDPGQLSLAGATPAGVRMGLVMAIFSFVGFESATTLGTEDRDPLRNIPRALSWSVLGSALFFLVTSYVLILGYRAIGGDYATADNPIAVLTAHLGHPFLGLLFSLGVIVSAMACALACVNAGARILFTLGRHGIVHPGMARTHRVNATPHHAVALCSLLGFALPAACVLGGLSLSQLYDYLGTIATYGFLTVYAMIAVAAPVSLRRLGQLRPRHLLHSGVSLLFLGLPLIGTFYPDPGPPMNKFPLWFLSGLALGVVGYACLRMKYREEIAERIEDDTES